MQPQGAAYAVPCASSPTRPGVGRAHRLRDGSGEARGVLAALASTKAADKRATLLQLCDQWKALKSGDSGVVSGKGMQRDEMESAIGQLLQGRVLALDFGYTAYTINAYLRAGPLAAAVAQETKTIEMALPATSSETPSKLQRKGGRKKQKAA